MAKFPVSKTTAAHLSRAKARDARRDEKRTSRRAVRRTKRAHVAESAAT